jgi:N-succinyldiaminopimelate aminotransferase
LERRPEIKVLSDDVYYFLPFDGRQHISFAAYSEENYSKTITIFSAGKMLNCTGWKVGWAVGPKDLIK